MEDRNEEIYKFLFDVMNGKINDVIVTKEKDENNMPVTAEVPVSISIRMKAAELLFKNVADNAVNNDILPVVICEDI
ncbi:MAG: hypothetical protein ACI4VF_10220 [Lachnospirales bacterium]